jgi:hypothetical protein
MRLKLTIVLLLLNGFLFALIWILDHESTTRRLHEAGSQRVIETPFLQNLERIEIRTDDGAPPRVLEKTGDVWVVREPVHWRANPFALEQLVFQLLSLEWESRFAVDDLKASGQTIADYGLAEPAAHLVLRSNETTKTLLLGDPTEIGGRLYMLAPDGAQILVISKDLARSLQSATSSFSDSSVFAFSTEEIRSIQVRDRALGNVRVRLTRSGDDWAFVSPIEAPADPRQVRTFLDYWTSLSAERLRPRGTNGTAVGDDSVQLTLEGFNSREVLTILGSDEGGREATHSDFEAIFTVPSARVLDLRQMQALLREKRLFHTLKDSWNSLEVSSPTANLSLQQLETGGWQVLHTNAEGNLLSHPAETAVVTEINEQLNLIEAVRFVSDAPSDEDLVRYGLQDPQRRIRLRNAEGQFVELKLGAVVPGDSLFYARLTNSNAVFLVRPQLLAIFPLDPLSYRMREIRSLPETVRIERIQLFAEPAQTASAAVVLLDSSAGNLSSRDEAILAQLKDWFRTLRVARYLDRPFTRPLALDEDTFVPWTFRVEADLSGTTPDRQVIYLSRRLGGSVQYLADPLSNTVAFLPISLIQALEPLLQELPQEPELIVPPDPTPVP